MELQNDVGECVLVPDDKVKTQVWAVQIGVLHGLAVLLTTICHGWSRSKETVSHLTASFLAFNASLMSLSLQKFVQLHKFTCDRLLYMYLTIKQKCFSGRPKKKGKHGDIRFCLKEGHSCCRKVISFFHMPQRRRWRMLSRACEFFVRTELDSFECWSLSESGHHLVEELGMLVGNPEGVCQR